jgi:DNA-binding NtrC family response regulator
MTEPYAKALLLDGNPDCEPLETMLEPYAAITRVETIAEALATAQRGEYEVLFCPWEHADGTWRSALEEIRQQQLNIPVIVYCHWAGEQEWCEVLKAGAFDLLVPPYTSHEVCTVLERAAADRRRWLEPLVAA